MKHFLALILASTLLVACSSEVSENRETRSTIYQGQTTWDMYENFGAPTEAVSVSDKEKHFLYRREEVTRDWTKMFFDWCDMDVTVVDDHVVSWTLSGNQCFLNVEDPVEITSGNSRKQMITPYKDQKKENSDGDTLF